MRLATLLPELFTASRGAQQLLVRIWRALLAQVMLRGILLERADSNANVMLPNSTVVARDPCFTVVVASFCSTADAADDFDFRLFSSCLLGRFLSTLLRCFDMIERI